MTRRKEAGLRWKQLEKGHEYNPGVCSASKCPETDVQEFAPGVKHPKRVYLCPKHLERWEIRAAARGAGEAPLAPTPAMALVPADTEASLEREASEAKDALDMIRMFEIKTQEDYDFANEALGEAKASWKDLEARKQAVTKPLNQVLRTVRAWFKPAQDFYGESERLLKAKLAEAHRKAAEAQEAALKAAQQAHAQGDADGVRQAMLHSATAEIQQADNVTIMARWCFEVQDPSVLPREYLCPDLKKIQDVVRELKDQTSIPGVRVFTEDTVIRRGA